jgi:nicotinamidase-related amidase
MITAIDKDTALVLIDLQKGIVASQPAGALDEVLSNAAKLIAAFRKANLPVVIVHVEPSGKFTKIRKEQVNNFPMPANFAEITPEIVTQPDDIFITKRSWGAFFETVLDEELQKRKVTNIVLGGVSTSIGVETTARQAAERGYNISFAKDAMKDGVPAAHENSLKYIFPRIGEIGTTDEIIEKIGERG